MNKIGAQPGAAPADAPPLLKVGVVVATLGRAAECEDLLACLAEQTLAPSAVVISAESAADVPPNLPADVEVVLGPRGLCAQRNRGVARLAGDIDIVVFFDDDFLPCRTSMEGIAQLFASFPDVVGATGEVLADGVTHGGIALDDAKAILAPANAQPPAPPRIRREIRTAYGCNMAFRISAMQGLRFDERLPLYGWQEDVDFAGQIAARGRLVETDAFRGVHRGVSKGRTPGVRLGFSQVVNPVYLARKGTMAWTHAVRLMSRNLLANHLKLVRPEPHIDRRGRAAGNWIGLAHIFSGQLEPGKILDLR